MADALVPDLYESVLLDFAVAAFGFAGIACARFTRHITASPMPRNIKVIHATDFIRATPEGKANLEKAELLLKEITEVGAGLDGFQVLVDRRRVTGHLMASELWYLADRLVHYRRTFETKTAIICPIQRFDHSRFFALCAENNGFNIQAFTSYEKAMQWLLDDDTPEAH
jgi:hypothetical protein